MKEYKLKINGTEYAINIINVKNDITSLTVNGAPYKVSVEGIKTMPARSNTEAQTPTMQSQEPVVKPSASSGSAMPLKSPLPGVILDINVTEGQSVKMGDTVLILEAMKMENNIEADRDGIIEKINHGKGDSVLEGDILLTIK